MKARYHAVIEQGEFVIFNPSKLVPNAKYYKRVLHYEPGMGLGTLTIEVTECEALAEKKEESLTAAAAA